MAFPTIPFTVLKPLIVVFFTAMEALNIHCDVHYGHTSLQLMWIEVLIFQSAIVLALLLTSRGARPQSAMGRLTLFCDRLLGRLAGKVAFAGCSRGLLF